MNIESTLELLAKFIAESHNISEEEAADIICYSLGTGYIIRAMDDKVGRLIKEGYFSGKRIPDYER